MSIHAKHKQALAAQIKELKDAPMPKLTKRQREILGRMRNENEELVWDSDCCYVGYERVSKYIVFGLIRLMALRGVDGYGVGKIERYRIGETGLKLLTSAEKAND